MPDHAGSKAPVILRECYRVAHLLLLYHPVGDDMASRICCICTAPIAGCLASACMGLKATCSGSYQSHCLCQVLRILGAAAMTASAVVSGIAITKDFGPDNASDLQKSMDILSIISSGIVVLGELSLLFTATETLGAVLGPVGVVIGVVALVLSFFM